MSTSDALKEVVALAKAKFVESIDLVVMLDKKLLKNPVRGIVDLSCGLGKDVKIAVFAKGDQAIEAKNAGADVVGADDLVEEILSAKKVDFDWCLSSFDLMPSVVRLSKILGPKGIMPNPKMNTVTDKLADLIIKIRKGRVKFVSDSYGLIHLKIGSVKFSIEDLESNLNDCIAVISNTKSENKNIEVKSAFLSTTMGVGSVKVLFN